MLCLISSVVVRCAAGSPGECTSLFPASLGCSAPTSKKQSKTNTKNLHLFWGRRNPKPRLPSCNPYSFLRDAQKSRFSFTADVRHPSRLDLCTCLSGLSSSMGAMWLALLPHSKKVLGSWLTSAWARGLPLFHSGLVCVHVLPVYKCFLRLNTGVCSLLPSKLGWAKCRESFVHFVNIYEVCVCRVLQEPGQDLDFASTLPPLRRAKSLDRRTTESVMPVSSRWFTSLTPSLTGCSCIYQRPFK